MMELVKIKVGFPDIEEFCLELESKYRSTATGSLKDKGDKSPEWQIVKVCMNLKLVDERKTNSELVSLRYNLRKKLENALGKNSRKARNRIKNLRCEAARRKKQVMTKNEEKLTHLRKKFRKSEEDKVDIIPDAIKDMKLEELSIFSKEKYEEITAIEYETEVIGDDVMLNNNERLILRLPPKFAIEENLPAEGLALDEELAYAKARMTISKEEEEKLEEDEVIEEDEELEEELEKTRSNDKTNL